MSALLDLLRANPGCCVTIYAGPYRRKARAGDTKLARGKKYVRQQLITREGSHVRNGRPVYEWVLIGDEQDHQSPHYSGEDWTRPKRKTATQRGGVQS